MKIILSDQAHWYFINILFGYDSLELTTLSIWFVYFISLLENTGIDAFKVSRYIVKHYVLILIPIHRARSNQPEAGSTWVACTALAEAFHAKGAKNKRRRFYLLFGVLTPTKMAE